MEFIEDLYFFLFIFCKIDGGFGYRLLCGGNKLWFFE